jgi:hypothetical protein
MEDVSVCQIQTWYIITYKPYLNNLMKMMIGQSETGSINQNIFMTLSSLASLLWQVLCFAAHLKVLASEAIILELRMKRGF